MLKLLEMCDVVCVRKCVREVQMVKKTSFFLVVGIVLSVFWILPLLDPQDRKTKRKFLVTQITSFRSLFSPCRLRPPNAFH